MEYKIESNANKRFIVKQETYSYIVGRLMLSKYFGICDYVRVRIETRVQAHNICRS